VTFGGSRLQGEAGDNAALGETIGQIFQRMYPPANITLSLPSQQAGTFQQDEESNSPVTAQKTLLKSPGMGELKQPPLRLGTHGEMESSKNSQAKKNSYHDKVKGVLEPIKRNQHSGEANSKPSSEQCIRIPSELMVTSVKKEKNPSKAAAIRSHKSSCLTIDMAQTQNPYFDKDPRERFSPVRQRHHTTLPKEFNKHPEDIEGQNSWKRNMNQIDDLEESGSERSGSEEESEDQMSPKRQAMTGLNPKLFTNPRVQFMARIYKASMQGHMPKQVVLPEIDLLELSEVMGKPHSKKRVEEIMLAKFKIFVRGYLAQKPENISYLEDHFDELYEQFGEHEKAIEKVIDKIKKKSDNTLSTSEIITEEKCTSEGLGSFFKVKALEVGSPQQVDSTIHTPKKYSEAYDFSPQSSAIASPAMPKGARAAGKNKFSKILLRPSTTWIKTHCESLRKDLKRLAMSKIVLNKVDPFFRNLDHFDTGAEFPIRTSNDSPAKSCRSGKTNRKRRVSTTSVVIQRDLLNLKNSKLADTKNFDSNLQKTARPVYLLEREWCNKIRILLTKLVLKEKEKNVLREMIYFKPELVEELFQKYENDNSRDKFLHAVTALVKTYKESPRNTLKIRLCFEETMNYFCKVGIITEKTAIQFITMYKYNNEDIMGIYELFIFNVNFQDFVETLRIMEASAYFEQNTKVKNELVQGEKTYNLLQGIQDYVDEFFEIYYSFEQRQLLIRMIGEANEDLVKFIAQNEALTTKVTQKFNSFAAFNVQLKQFLEKQIKSKYMKKMSIKMEKVISATESEEVKAKFDKIIRGEDFRVGQSNPRAVHCITLCSQTASAKCTKPTKTCKSSRKLSGSSSISTKSVISYNSVIREYRLLLVLESNNVSIEDMDKILMVNGEEDELGKKDRAIKDAIQLYFMLEDEKELMESLRMSGAFKSIK
jgi:hypothetical protein